MGSPLIVVLLAVAGALVGWFVRPVVAEHEVTLPSWPLPELCMAGLFALVAWRLGDSWRVMPVLVFAAALFALSVVDIQHYRLPNKIMYPATALCAVLIVVGELVEGSTDVLIRAAVGAVAYFVILFIFHIIYAAGLGYGDVKLARLLGLMIGWVATSMAEVFVGILWALFLGSILGTVIGLALMGLRKVGVNALPDPLGGKTQSTFPFGPALAIAGLVMVLWPATFAV